MKTRTIERSRLVPHTVDGETELVLDREKIEVPAPPRDWDQLVRTAVTLGAALLVTVSLTWTTASIGALLAMSVVAVVAYGAAVAFDAAWIMCMGVEWLLRYDPDRAALPRRVGHVALLISMGAVFADGYLVTDQWVVGAVGALVSALAKGGWTIAMRVHARPLDPLTQQWVAKRRAAVDGQLAMIPIRRELQRGRALVEAEQRSLAGAAEESGSADPESSGVPENVPEDPEAKVSPIRSGRVTTQEAVRNAWDAGIREPEAVLRTVRKATGKDVPQSSVDRYLRALKVGA
ncbi:protein transporter Sec31 [Streptomyces sp. NPDC049590]|uniref:protein transporter Sec31 n=1 Tax=Streptomyces sp. NPDC049590 TaxID=3154834 RepID=UPI00343C9C34